MMDIDLTEIAKQAWDVREYAYVYGPTKVGCAVLGSNGGVFVGCNIEHKFRSHDVHAEVNAITTMIASGEQKIAALLIAAERDRFTPCGACMDWIMQFAGEECLIGFQATLGGKIQTYSARDLMPYYPH